MKKFFSCDDEEFLCLFEQQTQNPQKVSIFISGFGVNMFGSTKTGETPDVVKKAYIDILSPDTLSLFLDLQNYNQKDSRISYPLTFEAQAVRVQKLITEVLKKYKVSEINITAQSIGCLVLIPLVGFIKDIHIPMRNLAVWGAPTFENLRHKERLTDAFTAREETKVDFFGETILCCKDEKKLVVKNEFWCSLERNNLFDNLSLISNLFSSVSIFCATNDRLYPDALTYYKDKISERCTLFLLDGESHTFRESQMQEELCRLMKEHYL